MTWMGHPLLKLHDTQECHFSACETCRGVLLLPKFCLNFVARHFFGDNVLDGFSCFYIVIVYSNFTFCGAYMLSFLASHTVSAKPAHPVSGGSKGVRGTHAPPEGSKFFQFHAVFGKICQNRMLAPPGELAPPPRGNPGSANASGCNFTLNLRK